MTAGMENPIPNKFSRDYWVSAEAIIPPNDYKEAWANVKINFSVKKNGKIVVSNVYKNKIEAESEELKIRAYMLLHLIAAVYEKIGWPDEEPTKVCFLKSDSGRPLLDVENSHSRVQFSLMKWVTPDWLEMPKVTSMAKYLAKMKEFDPITYTLFLKTRSYMLPESCRVKWEINIF